MPSSLERKKNEWKILTGKWIDEKNAYTYQLMGLRIDSSYRQWLKFTTIIKRPKQKNKTKRPRDWCPYYHQSRTCIICILCLHFQKIEALYNSYAIWKDNVGFLCFIFSIAHELAGKSRKGNLLRRVMSWIFFIFYVNHSSNDNYELEKIMPVWSKNEKCIFLLFLQFITKEMMKTLIYMKFVYKYGRCISFYIVCIILKFENLNSLKSHRSLHINKYNHVPNTCHDSI